MYSLLPTLAKTSSTVNCMNKWKRSCKHVIFHKWYYTDFQSDNCVFFIFIRYILLPLECALLHLYYIRHGHVYTHYISTERHGVQTDFTFRIYRTLHDWNRHRFRHRTHPTFGWYSTRPRRGKRSTTTRTQARSTAQGRQREFARPPWKIHTAPVYRRMDSSYTPFL